MRNYLISPSVLALLLTALAGCSDPNGGESILPATGGTVSTGGNDPTASGGSSATGGQTLGSGGVVPGTGGASTGGTGGDCSSNCPSGGSGGSAGGTDSGGAATGGAATGGEGSGGDASGGGSSGPTLPPITDYSESGPFSTVVENNVGPGGNYTVFRPDPLGEEGFLHAPIVFGPGIGQSVNVHTIMLTNFASHGFVVVGAPVLEGGPGDAQNRAKMQNGLDWIVEQNTKAGQYEGKIWVDHAVSMGFSVGGTSAVEIGGDDSVLTVVSIHGHTASADLHGTMLQTTGTNDTVGMPLQQNTYDTSEVPTFLATLTDAPHGYIEQNGGGEERPAILAWMRYFIYGDSGAEHYFYGEECVLCQTPWENPQRKNWN